MNPCPANDGYCNSTNSLNGYYLYDQWGYGFRNCTSYVAWVLAQDGVPTKDFNFSSIGDGNAYQWLIEAESSQWPQLNALTSNNPNAYQDNAVAVTTGNANNPGHVMFVVNANPGPTGYITVGEYESLETVSLIAKGIAHHGAAFAHWAALVGIRQPADLERFDEQYEGHHESLAAYAEQLLKDLNFLDELDTFEAKLPQSLRPYVRLDIEAFALDLLHGGDIMTSEGDGGIYVFRPL